MFVFGRMFFLLFIVSTPIRSFPILPFIGPAISAVKGIFGGGKKAEAPAASGGGGGGGGAAAGPQNVNKTQIHEQNQKTSVQTTNTNFAQSNNHIELAGSVSFSMMPIIINAIMLALYQFAPIR